MDQSQVILGAIYLFVIYCAIGLVAWGFRVRFMNGRREYCFPRRKRWVVLVASIIMLASMGLAYFFHVIGYALVLVGDMDTTFLEAIPEMYTATELLFVPASSVGVVAAAYFVGILVGRYDARHGKA